MAGTARFIGVALRASVCNWPCDWLLLRSCIDGPTPCAHLHIRVVRPCDDALCGVGRAWQDVKGTPPGGVPRDEDEFDDSNVLAEGDQGEEEEEERARKRRRGESEKTEAEVLEAEDFVEKVKARLLRPEHGGPHEYKAFLDALYAYNKSSGGTKEVYKEMSRIFADHPDLMEGFKAYLPTGAPQTADASHHQNCSRCGRSYHSRSGKPGGKCERCR